ncbi:uncharacterized protein LOC131160148 isoform X2 [Malania oleifera]|uniref:uncharacterized protein LOC131160148 isoform X2 n=1 Tax=Malania oleifera TaxID=397392 RepID=UPI0025AE1119|nr:uncharacterized protein LOC131160148 isoform X2 [Malania oleifera]
MSQRNQSHFCACLQNDCLHCTSDNSYIKYSHLWVQLLNCLCSFGSSFSICGYYRCKNRVDGDQEVLDAEQGIAQGACNRFEGRKDTCGISRSLDDHEESHARQVAGTWGFIFQICYQACAGAVVLTDSVYWLIIVPLFPADYFHSGFLPVSMHSVNAFLLIGDSILNRMRFPFFRIAYFFLFTVTYISFQWIIEGLFKIRSPYHFIDLSSPTTPLWYVFLALIHVPCYGIFAVIIWIKHFCLSRLLPESYQGMR